MTKLRSEIKFYAWASGKTLAWIADQFSMSKQHLDSILDRESLRYTAAKKIARICGYRIAWIKESDFEEFLKHYPAYYETYSDDDTISSLTHNKNK